MSSDSSYPTVKKCTPDCLEIEKGCYAYHEGWDCPFDENYKWYDSSPTTVKEEEK